MVEIQGQADKIGNMFKYNYIYQTSDHQRRTGQIRAWTRNGVYHKLRAKGIRPIAVNAVAWRMGKSVMFLSSIVLILGCWTIALLWGRPAKNLSHVAFLELSAKAAVLENEYMSALEDMKLDSIMDYGAIERNVDISRQIDKLNASREIVEAASSKAWKLFSAVEKQFPDQNDPEREKAKQLYGSIVWKLDEFDERISCLESQLTLLDENRDSWVSKNGNIIFHMLF